jgi:hypothetical protein
MEKGRVFTGARARFSIEGKKVGYATNVSGSTEIEYQPVDVLDNIETEEFAPTAYRVSLQASTVRIVGETLKSQGFFPQSGTSPAEHLQNILMLGDLVCTIEDSKTGKVIMTMEQVKAASENFSINARGIVGADMSFVGVRIKDESEVV